VIPVEAALTIGQGKTRHARFVALPALFMTTSRLLVWGCIGWRRAGVLSVSFDNMFDMTIAEGAETRMPGTPAQAHPVLAGVRDAISHVGAAAESAIWGLSDDALCDAIGACEQLRARTHALELALVRDVDGRDLGRRAGAASTAAWLTGRFRLRPGQARNWVQLANATDEMEEVLDYASNVSGPRSGRELVETAKALAAAEISPEHVAVVGKIMGNVPREVPCEQAARVEHDLAGYCREFDPATVAKLGDYLLELLRGEHLDDDEDDRHRRRTHQRGDGWNLWATHQGGHSSAPHGPGPACRTEPSRRRHSGWAQSRAAPG
jgi:hypothetical protein